MQAFSKQMLSDEQMRHIVNQATINPGACVTWDNSSHFKPTEIELKQQKVAPLIFFTF